MDDLGQWLRAQLDEDERIARSVPMDLGHSWSDPGPWIMAGDGGGGREAEVAKAAAGLDMPIAEVVAHHIAEHDPARVLREIDAKRELLADVLAEPHATLKPGGSTEIYCTDDSGDEEPCDCGRDARVARHLRLLALPYAARPGFRDEWRP